MTYLCDSGFIIDSNDTRVCGPNGLWSGDEPTCVGMYVKQNNILEMIRFCYAIQNYHLSCIAQVDCGPLLPPLNGQIIIGNTTTGNIATYLCDSGFIISDGNETRMCGFDGLWSDEEPTCVGMCMYYVKFWKLCIIVFLTESILLPFGISVGDELVAPALDGSSDPVSKLAFSNLSCPFYGVEEDILFVSDAVL